MTEEPKDVRLPFMVTASEAKAIDEWRYANHIPSRAEAMRLLINRGMQFQTLISKQHEFLETIIPHFKKGGALSGKEFDSVLEAIKNLTMSTTDIVATDTSIILKLLKPLDER